MEFPIHSSYTFYTVAETIRFPLYELTFRYVSNLPKTNDLLLANIKWEVFNAVSSIFCYCSSHVKTECGSI